jgi:hypothetical protein
VRLREGDCDKFVFDSWVEACGPRRLVKRNDTLFDLIRGCDLTRISAIDWADWHRSRKLIEWDDFEASFGSVGESERDRRGRPRQERSRRHLELLGGVLTAGKTGHRPGRLLLDDRVRGGARGRLGRGAPGTDTGPRHLGSPGHARRVVTRATLIVDAGWVRDAVKGDKTIFDEDPTAVEIEIRGDFIVHCNGQTVDANANGLTAAPIGNGTPGGTFFSSFHVQPRYSEYRVPDESADRAEGVAS